MSLNQLKNTISLPFYTYFRPDNILFGENNPQLSIPRSLKHYFFIFSFALNFKVVRIDLHKARNSYQTWSKLPGNSPRSWLSPRLFSINNIFLSWLDASVNLFWWQPQNWYQIILHQQGILLITYALFVGTQKVYMYLGEQWPWRVTCNWVQ